MTNYSLKPTDENALGLLKTDPIGRNKYIRRFIHKMNLLQTLVPDCSHYHLELLQLSNRCYSTQLLQ